MSKFWNFIKLHYLWLLTAVVLPFVTYGSFLGWSALTPYHTNEQEHALDVAPFWFALGGGLMLLPSIICVVLGLIFYSSVLRFGTPKGRLQVAARFLLSTFGYALSLALMGGIFEGVLTAYGPMMQHSTGSYKSLLLIQRIAVGLIFWTPINWIAALCCMTVIRLVKRVLPKTINARQKILVGLTAITALVLVLCPPIWVHDYVPSDSWDESSSNYYEGYLGHAPIWHMPPSYKFMEQELDPGLCTQLLFLEFVLLFTGCAVLWNLLSIKDLRWHALNELQRTTLITGFCLATIAAICPPWWSLQGRGYFWGGNQPMSLLGYASVIKPPDFSQPARREIIWPLLGLEASVIAFSVGGLLCLFQTAPRKETQV